MSIGIWEILILLVVVVFIFGAKRLPRLGEALGESVREYKAAAPAPKEDTAAESGEEKQKSGDSGSMLPLAADLVKLKAPGGKLRLLSKIAKKL